MLCARSPALWLPLCLGPASVPPQATRPALAAHTPWIPGPLSRPVDSAPSAAGRCPASLPGSPSSGALCTPRPKYPRARGWRRRAWDGEAQPARGATPEARLRGEGLGAQERSRRRGAPRAEPQASLEPRGPPAARTVRRWARSPGARSPVGLSGRVREGRREGGRVRGRGDAAAPAAAAAAACLTLGRASRGSGTCLRPCDPGAAPAAAPAMEAASSAQPGPGASAWSAPRCGTGVTLPRAP